MIVSIDTNIFAYAAGLERKPDDNQKIEFARSLIGALLPRVTLIVSTQVVAELYRLLLRHGWSRDLLEQEITDIRIYAKSIALDAAAFDDALDLALRHHLQIFDAMIVSASAASNARCLLTKDLQDGWVWRGVEIINPIGKPVEVTLARLGLER